jgi:hypothetical protein
MGPLSRERRWFSRVSLEQAITIITLCSFLSSSGESCKRYILTLPPQVAPASQRSILYKCSDIEAAASLQQKQCLMELLGFSYWVSDGELMSSHFFLDEKSLLNWSRAISSRLVCFPK